MKPRNYDPALDTAILLGVGQAHAVAEPVEEKEKPVGRIFVPDPEQRHGWREYYVQKPEIVKPGARPIGFGKP